MASLTKYPFISQTFNFEGYTLSRRQDGIIQIRFKEGFSIGVDDAKNMVNIIRKIKDEDEKCLLLVLFEEDNTFSAETREYIASDSVSGVIKADAFVIKGLALEILGQGYLKINRPTRPTRLFKSEELASAWLLGCN